jgi:hypothetical protein
VFEVRVAFHATRRTCCRCTITPTATVRGVSRFPERFASQALRQPTVNPLESNGPFSGVGIEYPYSVKRIRLLKQTTPTSYGLSLRGSQQRRTLDLKLSSWKIVSVYKGYVIPIQIIGCTEGEFGESDRRYTSTSTGIIQEPFIAPYSVLIVFRDQKWYGTDLL